MWTANFWGFITLAVGIGLAVLPVSVLAAWKLWLWLASGVCFVLAFFCLTQTKKKRQQPESTVVATEKGGKVHMEDCTVIGYERVVRLGERGEVSLKNTLLVAGSPGPQESSPTPNNQSAQVNWRRWIPSKLKAWKAGH